MNPFEHLEATQSDRSPAPPDLLLSELSSGEYGPAIASVTTQLQVEKNGATNAILESLPDKLFEHIHRRLALLLSPAQLNSISLAYEIASAAHAGVRRDDGSPYIVHPLRVAITLIDHIKITDCEIICQAILHDVIEDSGISKRQIRHQFGERVALGVAALSKHAGESLEDNLRRIAAAADTGAAHVKVADRIDNLRTAVYRLKLGQRLKPIEETERHFLAFAQEYAPELKSELDQAVAHATFLVRHTELYQDGFRQALRSAVLDLHESLGNLEILDNLDSPRVSAENYREYLKKVWGLLAPIERALLDSPLQQTVEELIYPIRMKVPLIKADLLALGVAEAEIQTLPQVATPPALTSLPKILGVLYTIEGSLLGGIAVRGNVEPVLELSATHGTSFLNAYGDVTSTTDHFELFMKSLEKIIASTQDRERFQDEVVLSAIDMFVLAHKWYH